MADLSDATETEKQRLPVQDAMGVSVELIPRFEIVD